MNELEEIMNGKHEIKHLKIDNDTLTFNTELNNYDWNLTTRDIEMIIYTLQEDKNNLQSKIDKANELLEEILVVSDWEHEGRFRPVKGTTVQDVYKTIVKLNELLETPRRINYELLKEDK